MTSSSDTTSPSSLHTEPERRYVDGIPGYYETEYRNGWVCLWYHYTSHPEKRDPDWAEEMARSYPGGTSGPAWKAEMEIDWGARAGELVYPSWDRQIHVIDPVALDPTWPRYRAIDPGWHNPTACLWGCLSPEGILYLYREHYRSGWTVPQHAQYIKGCSGREEYEWTVIDPSAFSQTLATQRSVASQFTDMGVICVPGDNDVEDGIAEVNEWLRPKDNGAPNIQVFRNLRETIREIEGYRFEVQTPEQASRRDPREKPVKKDDHLMDAMRYLVMSAPDRSKRSREMGLRKKNLADRVAASMRSKRLQGFDSDSLSEPPGFM